MSRREYGGVVWEVIMCDRYSTPLGIFALAKDREKSESGIPIVTTFGRAKRLRYDRLRFLGPKGGRMSTERDPIICEKSFRILGEQEFHSHPFVKLFARQKSPVACRGCFKSCFSSCSVLFTNTSVKKNLPVVKGDWQGQRTCHCISDLGNHIHSSR